MCGITGGIFKINDKCKPDDFISNNRRILSSLLLGIESRGREATGVAIINKDKVFYTKNNVTASKFLQSNQYTQLVKNMTKDTIGFLGHTRLSTQGSPLNNNNNHPFVCGQTIGIHNGSISNFRKIKSKFKLNTVGDCDSEVIFVMYNWAREKLKYTNREAVSLIRQQVGGMYACALYHKSDKDKLVLFRNSGPISISRCISRDAGTKMFLFSSISEPLQSLVKTNIVDLKSECGIYVLESEQGIVAGTDTRFINFLAE
jgi:glucosamine 6-phosphate synthetase-like amidotransferase/phosphosugar isomerase protein